MGTSIHKKNISSSGRDKCTTNLVCGVQDRLILNAFDTQQDLKTKTRTICGSSQSDIRMYHSPGTDFSLAQFGRSDLDRAQEARCFFFSIGSHAILIFIPMLM
jgi:hypothetical protein